MKKMAIGFDKVYILTDETLKESFERIKWTISVAIQNTFFEYNEIYPNNFREAWNQFSENIKIQPLRLMKEPYEEDPGVWKVMFLIQVFDTKHGETIYNETFASLVRGNSIDDDLNKFFQDLLDPRWMPHIMDDVTEQVTDLRDLRDALQRTWVATMTKRPTTLLHHMDMYLSLMPLDYTSIDGISVPSELRLGWFCRTHDGYPELMDNMPLYKYELVADKPSNKKTLGIFFR